MPYQWDEDTINWIPQVTHIAIPADAIMNGGNVRYEWDEETMNWVAQT